MNGVHLFMFVLALPALAALGHDAYLYYLDQGMGFQFAALGFIWTKYHPESYRWTVEATSPDYWPYINEILAQKAVAVGAVFAGFFYVILGMLKILGVWPFNDGKVATFSGNRRTDEILSNKKSGRFKYKRK
ncbi:MAG: hypothetical protein WBK55_06600 [Alphaproteobacteria bacterium]